ncbi:citrate synthase [Granulosicoccus antarcticus]|uniref:Citrate synthase n=1 Tax=Granulosicoccus antarcticus IMCC3135 TaxID=1192854 RepID=A0A2Z2P976_9GAMM|nr:citrate synthase [Granulosicoccus antarcticus]ASJ76444.1 Citrate synthase 1 [Granulosicoccus antarcticus IMCC3135]
MSESVSIVLDGKSIELPVVEGSEAEKGLDISKLRDTTGYITLDQGYGNTGSCESAITYIDGDAGILRYRGIPIEQFANRPNFIEVCWLLIFGNLPTAAEYGDFSERLTRHAMLNESMKHHFQGFPTQAPPMAILSAMINALSCFHPDMNGADSDDQFIAAAARLISKIRTIAAFAHRSSIGRTYNYPNPKLLYVENFMHMMFSEPHAPHETDEIVRLAFNLVLILHADHEQNCSTSTVRMVGSSGANLFASCAAGVCALWGPLHGGANVAVLDMLEQIHQGDLSVEEYMRLAKDKNSGVRLMGFGHRVYKNFDPRAKMLQEVAEKLLKHLNINDPLLEIGRRLEEIALNDSYFVERKLYPNVDFYSGIILRALGIPTNMFTVIFAMGRMPGWIAHWREQNLQGARIGRPRQIYTGPTEHDYVPRDQRGWISDSAEDIIPKGQRPGFDL